VGSHRQSRVPTPPAGRPAGRRGRRHGAEQRRAERIPAARSGHEQRCGLLARDRRQHLHRVAAVDGQTDVEVEPRPPWLVAQAAHTSRVEIPGKLLIRFDAYARGDVK
jgi:hypothetical protein